MTRISLGYAAVAASFMLAACSTDKSATAPDMVPLHDVQAAANGTVLVLPTEVPDVFTEGWFGYGDRVGAAGLASIGTAPATQYLGNGSLSMMNTAHGWEVAAPLQPAVPAGTRLDAISELSYATYTPSGQAGISAVHQVSLQFTIDYDVNDSYEGFQGRLVFEAYHCNTVSEDTWTSWNTLDAATTGCWWQTANPASATRAPYVNDVQQAGALPCPQSNPCTMAEVIAAYPDAGFHNTNLAQGMIFKVGTPWLGTFYADALVVGIGGASVTYDFEPYDVAENADECKQGGWQNVTRADGSTFKNQGACVSYTQTGK